MRGAKKNVKRLNWSVLRRAELLFVAALILFGSFFILTQQRSEALANGDGILMYGENGSIVQPRWRAWTNATNAFGSESSLPNANDVIHQIQVATSPNRQEAIAAVTSGSLSAQLHVYLYNGNSWSLSIPAVSSGISSSASRFDVAYDQVTGKAIVAYSTDTAATNEIAYQIWDGSAWSGVITYDAQRTSDRVGYLKLLPRPGTDEIAMIWADDTNNDLSANYYDMSSGTWSGEPASALSTNIARVGTGASLNSNAADLAFENVSGDLQVCWGEEGIDDLYCSIRTAGTGGSWGAATAYTSFAAGAVDMSLASEPGTDYIAYANMRDGTVTAEAGIWDGSTWGNISNFDSSANSVGSSTANTSVGWLVSGGQSRVVVTYDDQLASGVDWTLFNKNTSTWAVQTDITTSPQPGNFNDLAHKMRANPFNSSELMFFLRDSNHDLFTKKLTFDGTTVTWTSVEPSGASPETNMSDRTTNYAWSIDFSYYSLDNTKVIDPSAAEQGTYHDGSAPNNVFISDQVGYTFYRDRGGQCVYTKTTDGGTTWSATVTVISPSACFHVAVWYDRWTPGDTTGTYIHIVTVDGTVDDLKYNRLDTSGDTLLSAGTPTAITSTPGPVFTNDFITHDNYPAITKATDGTLYTGVHDSDAAAQESYVVKCSTTCNTASNWSDTSIALDEGAVTQAKNYALLLQPLASGNVMAIVNDVTNSDVLSKVYNSGTTTWDAGWTTIDASAGANTTWAGIGISAVTDKRTYKVYLAYTASAASLGTDDDFRTAVYDAGTWSATGDAVTNSGSKGLITPQLVFNENNGDIIIAYTARTSVAVANTANVYWKKSSDGMTSWGSEQGPLNTTTNDLWGIRTNVMSNERLYVEWTDAPAVNSEPRLLRGDTIEDVTPPTYSQSGFRLFANNDATTVGSSLAATDTAATLSSAGGAFRLRMLMHVAGSTARANIADFKLQYAGKGAGTCAAPSGTPSSYADVTAGTLIAYNNNATPADGDAATVSGDDPQHSSDTVRLQSYEELNNFSNTINAIASGEDGLWDFALYDNGAPIATAYCFRIVSADGTTLSSYSQYPQITTSSVTNQDPDVAASLTQTKTTTANIATSAWTNESSVRFTAQATDPDSSDTLQLCVEKKPLGTAFDSNAGAETCGSGVAYSGSAVGVEATISGHSQDEYHWQARIKDAAGGYSAWTSYGSNAESVRDYGVDTSTPTGGAVYDGTNAGVDAAFNDNSLSSLSANWSGFNADISGLDRYEYSIGTTVSGTDIRNWTSNTTSTSVTATGLTLQTSQAYYINVRAIDNAGNAATISSDGQLVLPSLSFGISSNNITFSNLNVTNSYTDSQATTITTSTNAYGGYMVRAFATDYLRANALTTIPDFNGGTYSSPDSWQGSDTGFGYTSSDSDVQGVNKFQAGTCPGGSALAAPGCFAAFSQTKPGDIVADHTANVTGTPITNQQFTVTYRVTADPSQPAAPSYATTVVYSVVPVY